MAYKNDEWYIDRVLNHNDPAAFEGLINKHKTMAFNIALRITGSREDAEEVAQDAFVKVYHSLSGFKGDSKFTTWFYRVVYNMAISKTRKKSLIEGSVDEDGFIEPAGEEAFETTLKLRENDRKKFVSEAIATLDPADQLLITLYYMDEQSVEDIASITGLSASNIKVKLFRCRKRLHDVLKKNLKEELHSIL